MRTRLFCSGVVFLATAAIAAVMQMPSASAEDKWAWCPNGAVCVSDNVDGTGAHGIFKKGAADLGTWKNGALNDRISIVWNRSATRFYIYEHKDYKGACGSIAAGNKTEMKRMQDLISSVRVGKGKSIDRSYCTKALATVKTIRE